MKEPVLLVPGEAVNREYQDLVKQMTPPRPILANALTAFLVGGAVSAAGQLILNYWLSLGIEKKQAAGLTSLVVVALASLLTGLGIYDRIGRFGGMGSALPISGFANSMTAPAMEFKREGWVLGVGTRMFIVAGPVIVYGLISAVLTAGLVFFFQGGPK